MSHSAISIQGVSKDFSIGIRGVRLRAVDNLSLEVPKHAVFGLLGPNGCGKSTTMKIVLGLIRATRGTCQVFGMESHRIAAKSRIGYLPEAPYFYKYLSGRELLKYYGKIFGLKKDKLNRRIDEVLEWVNMRNACERRVGTYSKGMLQRIGIAQALVHDPDLLILDEPTAGVDPVGSSEMAELIRALKQQGKTVFLCSHLLTQVEDVCDEIAIMDKGCLQVSGSVDALLEKKDQRAIKVKHMSADLEARALEALRSCGVDVEAVETPKVRLDRLFMEQIRRESKP